MIKLDTTRSSNINYYHNHLLEVSYSLSRLLFQNYFGQNRDMVHVVNNSSSYGYGCGYREINQQLAKDNGELKQQLSGAVSEIAHLRSEIHHRDVEILDLNRQIRELRNVKSKYIAIREIILDKGPVESIHQLEASIRAIEQAHDSLLDDANSLPSTSQANVARVTRKKPSSSSSSPSDKQDSSSTISAEETANSTFDANNSDNQEANVLHRISERSEESNVCQSSTNQSSQTEPKTAVEPPQQMNDSLDPPDVTSVPPLQPERTMHTPSIWNCLDPLDPPDAPSETSQQNEKDVTQQEEEKKDQDVGANQPQEHEQESHQSHIHKQSSPPGNAGLKVSNNINASSPIQPITRKGNHLLADCMFQSTPVQKQREPSIGISPISDLRKDNQENLQGVQSNELPSVIEKPVAAKKGKGKRQKPVNREVTFGEEPVRPTRYNLRKRSKV